MLVGIAFVPDTPLVVPAVSGDGDAGIGPIRRASVTAVAEALRTGPDVVVIVGPGLTAQSHPASDWGSLRGFGVDVRVALGAGACGGRPALSPALTVGAWLVHEARKVSGPRSDARAAASIATHHSFDVQGFAVPHRSGDADVDMWAAELANLDGRVVVVAAGSGSARHGPGAPGGPDVRAKTFDDRVVRALTDVRTGLLADLDPTVATEMMCSGATTWRLVSRAVRSAGGERTWRSGACDWWAPYGVGYFAATWGPG